ncbi:kinase 2B, chloroplastic-like [Olea europaea subsp. europaea]|uniref:Kinase 2B, chloroplastic-like n=1 Tax=Olea europaea subsp. europaea TaxID=158383 RepID=A0A8S0UX09_OLEEU|nr:kinase 2B, chloroplastic-like [Olea europaea subsp. europaea]
MSRIYHNWERLVGATLKREELRELARAPSLSSVSSDCSSRSLLGFQSSCNFVIISRFSFESPSSSNSNSLPTPRSENQTLKLPIPKPISFKELKNATRNFQHDTILAEGACGPVFKGWINKHNLTGAKPGAGIAIVVKMCNFNEFQDSTEMLTEINYLSQLYHPNLLKLIGYCCEGDAILLVNEFMSKRSLDSHLFRIRQRCLSWTARIMVAVGAARGLSFLHDAEKLVIHRVFQSSNILLDQDFNAKLSGIDLTKEMLPDHITHVSTRVMGTYGYAAPEYIATGHLTYKCDAIDRFISKEQVLVDWARPYLSKKKVHRVVDAKLKGKYPQKAAIIVSNLALQCTSKNPKSRPRMAEVLATLEPLQGSYENKKSRFF